MDERNTIVRGNLLIRDGRIISVGEGNAEADIVIDAQTVAVFPVSFRLTYLLCQTLLGSSD